MRDGARWLRWSLDVGIVLVAVALIEVADEVGSNAVGSRVAGPTWLVVLLPLLWAAPLLWRRSHPLAVWTVIIFGLSWQALLTGNSPEGLEVIFVIAVGSYSVAAHASRRASLLGLAIAIVGYTLYAVENRDIRTGKASELWAGAFFGIGLLFCWLLGTVVREVKDRRLASERARRLEVETDRAIGQERARLARELHDIVSHNLSVVVVQAAGARAKGNSDPVTLEKIERSGRESLVEMRRLLGVLRASPIEDELAPQPRLGELPALVDQVRDAGVQVELRMTGETAQLPSAIELSVYRIVQEALTNVVKHAGKAMAIVTITRTAESVHIEVVDDGCGQPADTGPGGHGLLGMRERVALLHGDFRAGARPGGGFEVSAVLPVSVTT